MTTPTHTGDVIGVYSFENLRASLLKATKAVAGAPADDDDGFRELCNDQNDIVAELAERTPVSADEAVFLMKILRDQMAQNFVSGPFAAVQRNIVRSVAAYLSATIPQPHNGTPLVKTDWRKLLDEYRRLAQTAWDATCQEDDARDSENCPALERAATAARRRCENIERRIAELEVDGLSALAVKMAVAWTDIVPEFEFRASNLPIKALSVRSMIDFLSRETGLDLFVEFDREGRGKLPRYDDPEREGDTP